MATKSFKYLLAIGLVVSSADAHALFKKRSESKAEARARAQAETLVPDSKEYYFSDQGAPNQKEVEARTGSLWANTYSSRLYDNMYRANKIGDTVMVVVDENARGVNKGDTKSDKKMEHTAGIDALGGLMEKLSAVFNTFNPSEIIDAETESKFKGSASTNRSGSLSARITATVTRVLSNGNMMIRGEQHLKINKEDQVLIVEGIIRPYDIQPDNTVLSSALADARISFTGFGIVAERQSPGWLVRALDYIWPF